MVNKLVIIIISVSFIFAMGEKPQEKNSIAGKDSKATLEPFVPKTNSAEATAEKQFNRAYEKYLIAKKAWLYDFYMIQWSDVLFSRLRAYKKKAFAF